MILVNIDYIMIYMVLLNSENVVDWYVLWFINKFDKYCYVLIEGRVIINYYMVNIVLKNEIVFSVIYWFI